LVVAGGSCGGGYPWVVLVCFRCITLCVIEGGEACFFGGGGECKQSSMKANIEVRHLGILECGRCVLRVELCVWRGGVQLCLVAGGACVDECKQSCMKHGETDGAKTLR
jgi:hypothetical protein